MTIKRTLFIPSLLATSSLVLFLGCGGTSTPDAPAKATSLEYTDPAGSGWRLVKAATSTSTHLVLELRAPAAATGQGVGLKLTLDETTAQWAKVATTDTYYVKNVAYDLGTNAATQLYRGTAKNGDLVVGVYQKSTAHPVIYSGALLNVAVDFKAAGSVNTDTLIPLLVSKAEHVAADGSIVDVAAQLQVGTLKAK